MTTYSGTYKGIQISSNMPIGSTIPHGNYMYTVTINYSMPIVNALEYVSLSMENILDSSALQAQLQKEVGADSTITNVNITTPNATQVVVTFNATSPPILLVISVIFIFFAIAAYFISNIVTQINSNPVVAGGFSVVEVGVGLLLVGAAAFIIYLVYNSYSKKKADIAAMVESQNIADYDAQIKRAATAKRAGSVKGKLRNLGIEV